MQNIVRQSGGAVWVSSEIGQGSTFTVCLPRAVSGPGLVAVPRPVRSYSGTETILLVEDDSGVRHLLARVLRDRGYTVIEACHSEDALALFEKHGREVHLVLTDVVMPGISGLELAKILRGQRADLKILCMSGYTEDVLVSTGSFTECRACASRCAGRAGRGCARNPDSPYCCRSTPDNAGQSARCPARPHVGPVSVL